MSGRGIEAVKHRLDSRRQASRRRVTEADRGGGRGVLDLLDRKAEVHRARVGHIALDRQRVAAAEGQRLDVDVSILEPGRPDRSVERIDEAPIDGATAVALLVEEELLAGLRIE